MRGAGAVFVALDGELNREVALKQILEKHADDPVSRGRFVLEAEITGGLEYPGIVPVYGLGTYSDGRPYYAMRLIEGDSLKEAIDRFHVAKSKTGGPGAQSLERHKLLRRFTDVCNAIEYAHSRRAASGHQTPQHHRRSTRRDAGGRLGPGEGDGQVRSVDPGADALAFLGKRVLRDVAWRGPGHPGVYEPRAGRGPARAGGAVVGCLQPRCNALLSLDRSAAVRGRGGRRDPRRAAGRVPSAGPARFQHRRGARDDLPESHGPADRRPVSLVPRLADDLDRWMADEPVSAWREPFRRRARRWSRRNRTAVTAAGVALVAGVAGLVALAGVQAQANSGLRTANTQVKQANTELAAEKARVQERYDLAMEAIKTFHTGVSEDFLLKEEKFKDLRDRLLKSASEFYGKLGGAPQGPLGHGFAGGDVAGELRARRADLQGRQAG